MDMNSEFVYIQSLKNSPTNQSSYYWNQYDEKITALEKAHQTSSERLDTQYNDLQDRLNELSRKYSMLSANQRTTRRKLSNILYSLEDFDLHMNNHVDDVKKHADKKIRKLIRKQTYFSIRLEEMDFAFDDFYKLENRFGKSEQTVETKILPFVDQQEEVNESIRRKLTKQESVVFKKLLPMLERIERNLDKPIINLLSNLSPGTKVKELIVDRVVIYVKYFADYNVYTNIATFIKDENHVLSVDANKINSLSFS
ncbi:hypothetical protein QWT69_13180 [Sporosarcina oncorhynchi]|uniref:Uncharacterized protein n=1 Tax=Sporosarcina oncorhynchi TaxID=3056444 RepID=A0ABZ0L5F8_9BACL|nr:hypothetical protein [Sporosarcina sp. T2O-4]WOV86816.1 hypothetical protein QWT69_13180 [Sporosarcina sp. T2O-4]